MARILISSLLLTLAFGCSLSPRRITVRSGANPPVIGTNTQGTGTPNQNGQTGQTGQTGQQTPPPAPTDDLTAMLNRVNSYLEGLNYQRIGAAVRNTNMPEGGIVAYAIQAQTDRCYVAVAMSAPSNNLDIIALDPRGQRVNFDVLGNATPHVRICPTQPGRHIARLQMASGSGEYYYMLFQGPREAQVELASVLGVQSEAPTVAQAAPMSAETTARLQQLESRFVSNNFRRIADPNGFRLEHQGTRRQPVNLTANNCYAFASMAGHGARDTNLEIRNGSQETVAVDRSVAPDAVFEYCPTVSGLYTLESTMYAGRGDLYIVGWHRGPQNQGVTPAPTAPIIDNNQGNTGGGLEEAYGLVNADILARGYIAYGDTSEGQLSAGQTQTFDLSLEGDKCYAIIAVGDNGVQNLDLSLLDSRGRTIDEDTAPNARPIVRVCASSTGEYRMQVKATTGQGNFVYHAYRWPRGTRGPFGLAGLTYVRLAEVSTLLAVEGYEPGDFDFERGSLRQGRSARHQLRLNAGQCIAALVVGGEGVTDLDVTLSSGSTQHTADGTSNAFPTVRHCATQSGTFTVNIQAASGSGDYFMQVFERTGS